MKKFEKDISGVRIGILFAVILFIIFAAVFIWKNVIHADKIPYEKNRKKVEALAEEDISKTEKELRTLYEKEHTVSTAGEILTKVELKRAFENSVILGDSFSESIVEYGYLGNDVVLYQRGASISQIDELMKKAIGLKPAHVFMNFGSNDLENDKGDAGLFIEQYRSVVTALKASLPDADFYVNCILPVSDRAIELEPDFSFCSQFNEALKTMCEEMGIVYIDSSFLVEEAEDIYEPDGIHVTEAYYPRWLSLLANTAGI